MRLKSPKGIIEVSSASEMKGKPSNSTSILDTDLDRWSDNNSFEKSWEIRAQIASNYIPKGATVLDLGCGMMSLEKYIPPSCNYIPCDIVKRDERTIVCDFNKLELPEKEKDSTDIIVMLGVWEYIYDLNNFLLNLKKFNKPCLISYSPTDWSKNIDRKSLGWINNFSLQELKILINKSNFNIDRIDRIGELQVILHLTPEIKLSSEIKKVAILSFNNLGNFGDRLGYHLINNILPSNVNVEFIHFNPWDAPKKEFDLLIIGIGNSLFQPVINKQLFSLIDQAEHTIGIFGTQYREDIPKELFKSLIDRLTHWYCRYEEDVYLYGNGRNNVTHLGDWLISAFPMSEGNDNNLLKIGNEIWNDLPMDRVIQNIQKHRKVFSTRLHPLLCALTSANEVAYVEQREMKSGEVSGKFRSMLIDVFHRTYPENTFWEVDREMVISYKKNVANNIIELSKTINSLI